VQGNGAHLNRYVTDEQRSRFPLCFFKPGKGGLRQVRADLDGDWTADVGGTRFDTVFALDVLEHLKSPERTVEQIFSVMTPGSKLYASTGSGKLNESDLPGSS
jgi:hypothetical protein